MGKMFRYILIGIAVRVAIAYLAYLYVMQRHHSLPEIYGGRVDPAYQGVEDAFKSNFEDGWENEGASFTVMHKGQFVVDIWGGYADSSAVRPWTGDMVAVVMSSTKAVASVCIAILVDRGHLDYGNLVTNYWPEFGKHEKDNVTVKMLAGLAKLDDDVTVDSVRDWKKMAKLLENQRPNWPPGTKVGYHMASHGWLLDQLVRRSDPQKRSLATFFREEIAIPHNINFQIGIPRDEFHRLARHLAPQTRHMLRRLKDWEFLSFMFSMWTSKLELVPNFPAWFVDETNGIMGVNNPDVMELEMPATSGVGNSRSLVELFNLFDSGQLTKSDKVLTELRSPTIFNTEIPDAFYPSIFNSSGHGFMHTPSPVGTYTYGHAGYGGTNIKVDHTNQLVYSYVTNGYSPDAGDMAVRFSKLQSALYECFKNID